MSRICFHSNIFLIIIYKKISEGDFQWLGKCFILSHTITNFYLFVKIYTPVCLSPVDSPEGFNMPADTMSFIPSSTDISRNFTSLLGIKTRGPLQGLGAVGMRIWSNSS